MKISPEDSVLTAYTLGELDASSRSSVEAALAKDDVLAQEEAAISSLAGLLNETLQGETLSLGESRHEEILKAGRRPDADILILDHRRRSRRQSLIAVVGVAAVVVAGFYGLSRFETVGPKVTGSSDVASAGGNGGETSALPSQPVLPNGVAVQGGGSSQVLPLDVKSADPSFVEKTLAETGALPLAESFQIESWVNAGGLSSAPLLTVGNVGAYTELGPCPWDEGKALLLVNLRIMNGMESSVRAALNFSPERVESALLLGSFDLSKSATPQSGVIQGEQTYLYQIELRPGYELVGSLDLEVEDHATGYLPLLTMPRAEASVSSDFAAVCVFAEFAQWGASESRDPAILRKLASTTRSLLSEVTNEKTRYALDMVLLSEESLKK